ncbi:histone H1.5-like [Anarhichas minor]|uniref:histone H1.5-like n=1 Tax=Anarhichas minor TaxID=65739 RepID=UPI003F7336CE
MYFIRPASSRQPGHLQTNTAEPHGHAEMAEELPAAPPSPVRATKAARSPKRRAARPSKAVPPLQTLIIAAVTDSSGRKGVSLPGIKKVLADKGVDVAKSRGRIITAVNKLVTNGTLTQASGSGASGSFKLAKAAPKTAKPAKKAVKKSVKAAKPAAVKRTPVKKRPVKKAVRKSPKKVAKKPAAKKTSAKKASPKKAAPKKASPRKSPKPKPRKRKAPAKRAAAKKK